MKRPANAFPIDDARHNVVELGRELALLEGHVDDPERHCQKCVIKHLLTIEALASEAIGLDHAEPERQLLEHVLAAAHSAAWQGGRNPTQARQAIRLARRHVVTRLLQLQGTPNILHRS